MVYRAFKRTERTDNLIYADDGAVSNLKLTEDYISDTNSSFEITAKTEAQPTDIIALIEGVKTIALGVITSVDNTERKITFKSMLNIFNVSILNPLRSIIANDDNKNVKYKYNQEDTKNILLSYFSSSSVDPEARYPLEIVTSGTFDAIWDYRDNTINAKDWLIDLFNDKNVVLQFGLVFEDATNRNYIRIRLAQVTSIADNIKDNVYCQRIISSEVLQPKATVAWVLDKDTKKLMATYYLLDDNTITTAQSHVRRVYPYLPQAVEFDKDNKDGATVADAAKKILLNNLYRHQIKIKYSDIDSAMYPKGLQIGDSVKIIVKDGTIYDSIYTGSEDNQSVLIFGKARTKLSDIMLQKIKSRR